MTLPKNLSDWKPFYRLSYDRKVANLIKNRVPESKAKARAEYLVREQFRDRNEDESN